MAFFIRLILIVALLMFPSCAFQQRSLEREYIFQLKVVENPADRSLITVSGLSGHSALAVTKIEDVVNNDHLNIRVIVAPQAGWEMSGSFVHTLRIPPQVNRVSIGREEELIWTRRP